MYLRISAYFVIGSALLSLPINELNDDDDDDDNNNNNNNNNNSSV